MHTSSTLRVLLLLPALALCTSCDSSDAPADPDLDGTWRVVMFSDATGDLTPVINQVFHSVTFTFGPDGSFVWEQDGVDDEDDDTIGGMWALQSDGSELRVNLDDGGFTVQVDFSLQFENDDTIRLETGADRFNEFAQSDFIGRLEILLERVP